ncbi:uncharacterized protein LOC119676674 [Teleopsis dalmanni]|uniref:uncharacterized protein LOC119676674 n=1 Tax=Teleopsis dalmanni TaxID=139649 RepID=UPI0018CDDA50|nr:uncharacterized protein LOC119676674 [Teleopsis dalmanni]
MEHNTVTISLGHALQANQHLTIYIQPDSKCLQWTEFGIHENDIQTCMFISREEPKDLQQHLQIEIQNMFSKPVLHYTNCTTYSNGLIYNRNMLIIVEWDEELDLLQNLAQNLERLRQAHIIFIYTGGDSQAPNISELFEPLFEFCRNNSMINAIAIFPHFVESQQFYSYSEYPKFNIETKYFPSNATKIFPERMQNLKGHEIVTLPDQISPRTILYQTASGEKLLTGYVAKMTELFAHKLNGTLTYSLHYNLTLGKSIFYRDFTNFTRNGTVELPTSISNPGKNQSYDQFTYPFELANFCLMVPVELEETYIDFFLKLLHWTRVLGVLIIVEVFSIFFVVCHKLLKVNSNQPFVLHCLDLFFHPHALSGILGFSFFLHPRPLLSLRLLYIVLFVVGLIATTFFNVELNAFLTTPSAKKPIRSLDDIKTSNLKILMGNDEFNNLLPNIRENYRSCFELVNKFEEYSVVRDSLNTKYAYPVTTSKWYVFEAQQRLFERPLFRLTKICFEPLMHLGYILAPDSIFKEPLQQFILRVQDLGLDKYWLGRSFYDLAAIGNMSFKDLSTKRSQGTRAAIQHINMSSAQDSAYIIAFRSTSRKVKRIPRLLHAEMYANNNNS